MPMDGLYLENAGAIFNGMPMDGLYLENAGYLPIEAEEQCLAD